MLKASRGFMVGKLSTESCKCNSFNQDRYFGSECVQRRLACSVGGKPTKIGVRVL